MPSTLLFNAVGYDVVCYVVADYVDFLIAGVMDYPYDFDILTMTLTPEEKARNPVVPLFSVSHSCREMTRNALSQMLDIPRRKDNRCANTSSS